MRPDLRGGGREWGEPGHALGRWSPLLRRGPALLAAVLEGRTVSEAPPGAESLDGQEWRRAPTAPAAARGGEQAEARSGMGRMGQGSATSTAASQAILGIDVANAKFDVAVLLQGKLLQRSFAMTAQGFEALQTWIGKQGVDQVHACREATGAYGASRARCRYEAGHMVSSVNPARIAA